MEKTVVAKVIDDRKFIPRILWKPAQISCDSIPSISQPSILRPPLIIRRLDLVTKGNFLCGIAFILRPPEI